MRPSGPVEVIGDRDELVQVFQNLVENAIRYGASGGRVDVRLELRQVRDGHRAASWCRTTGRASRPSTCRG